MVMEMNKVVNLLQRSVVEFPEVAKKEWESVKPVIIASVQSQYYMWAKQGFIKETHPIISDELILSIKKCNMTKEHREELIRRLT
jgi:hypothetical protein